MNTSEIINRIQSVIGPCEEFTPLHIPIFDDREVEFLKECVESNFVSSVGAFCDRFEQALAEFTGVKRAVLCMNGTSALHLGMRVAGVVPGDEVLIPSLTFVATGNATHYAGAIPHFVEVDSERFGVDAHKLSVYLDEIAEVRDEHCVNKATGRVIRALIPMHAFGHPVDLDALIAVAERFHLQLVEDAAESLGSFYKGKHTGGSGVCGALSFNGNKVITTGGGGALLFNDEVLADRAKYLSTTAKRPHRWEFFHDEIGYNYRMPALNAAMGCAQMEKLPWLLERKRLLAKRYENAFADAEGLQFVTEPEDCRSNYWLNALLLDDESPVQLEDFLGASNSQNVMTRPVWTPLHQLPMFAECPSMPLPVTLSLAQRLVNIPSTASLV